MAARKPLIAGNWKMYGRSAALGEIPALWAQVGGVAGAIDALICPPAPYIAAARQAAAATGVQIGAQDCSPAADDSARTGEVNAAMLADVGARYVIVGHSERRTRESTPADARIVVAYEPVWAIGGASTPTIPEIEEVHHLIRETLAERLAGEANGVRILYGGSVGPKNAAEIFAAMGVDGALVGRASLKAADFAAIILSHPAAK
jgi:triosephosphate isomerase